jgi:potassium-dependent mechanosensitive channel
MKATADILGLLTQTIRINGVVFPFSPATFFLELLLPAVLLIVLTPVFQMVVRRIALAFRVSGDNTSKTVRVATRAYRILVVLMITMLAMRLFGAEVMAFLDRLYHILNQPFFVSGSTRVSLVTLVSLIPLFYLSAWAARITRNVLDTSVLDRLSLDPAKKFTLSSLARYTVMGLVMVLGLSVIGIDLSSLAVLFGVVGIGLGFGLQHVVANFFSGLVIMMARPIKEGDRIQVGEYEGTVEHIRMISTVVNTLTHESLIIPNSQIVNTPMHNYSFDDRQIQVRNVVQVSYASDLDQVIQVLGEVVKDNPYRVEGRDPVVLVRSFDDSGITMVVLAWIHDANHKYRAISWINLEIWRAFKKNGIEIPFPQRDLHVRTHPAYMSDGKAGPELDQNDPADTRGT